MRLLSIRFCALAAVGVLLLGSGGCDRFDQFAQQVAGVLLGMGFSEQPVSGPVAVGTEWLEIVPPSPLSVVENEQSIRLQVAGVADIDIDGSMTLVDGRRVRVTAEVIDDRGARYPLKLEGISGMQYAHVFFSRDGDYPPGPDFPPDRTIVKLRMHSDAPFEVEEIRWICATDH